MALLPHLGYLAMAVSMSVSYLISMCLNLVILRSCVGCLGMARMLQTAGKSLVCGLFAIGGIWWIWGRVASAIPGTGYAPQVIWLSVLIAVGLATYFCLALLFQMEEALWLKARLGAPLERRKDFGFTLRIHRGRTPG